MMLQILLNHLFRHLPNFSAKIASSPKMSSPISLLQMRKFLEQSTCRISFDPPHNLTRCYTGCGTHSNMHMILADYTPYDPYFKRFTDLTNHCSNSLSNFSCQTLAMVFCHPSKVTFNLKNSMTAISVVHDTPQNEIFLSVKDNRLKAVGFNPLMDNNLD